MKKILLIFALMVGVSLRAQVLNPIQTYQYINNDFSIYNEYGTEVFTMVSGDTLVTSNFDITGVAEIKFGISCGAGDSAHFVVGWQFVEGTGGTAYFSSSNSGVYRVGAGPLSTVQDSVLSAGTVSIAATALNSASAYVPLQPFSGWTILPTSNSPSVAKSDSIGTYTVNTNLAKNAVRFYIICPGGVTDLGKDHLADATSLFKNAVVTISRIMK